MHPGFFHQWKRARACAHAAAHAGGHAAEAYAAASRHGGGFGVRRPLRVMSYELELTDEQTATLARLIDDLKTERAQAAVHERRSVGMIADAMLAGELDRDALQAALNLRVQAAEQLRDAVLKTLEQTHAMLEPEQRKKLAYLLRSGAITI